MAQFAGGVSYTPFASQAMGNVGKAIASSRAQSLEKQKNELAQSAWMGDPQAMQELTVMDPQLAMQVEDQQMQRKAQTQQESMAKESAARAKESSDRKKSEAFIAESSEIMEKIAKYDSFEQAQDYGQKMTDVLMSKYPDQMAQYQMEPEFTPEDFLDIKTQQGETGDDAGADERFFKYLVKDMNRIKAIAVENRTQADKDTLNAINIELGRKARAGSSAAERIANDQELARKVADSQSLIAGQKEFAKLSAGSRRVLIDTGFETLTAIDANLLNFDRAVDALNAGAQTGEITRLFPTFIEATHTLNQVQKELALDIVGGTKFGQLSKGELDLALSTALPTGLNEEELLRWLEAKKIATTKLRNYYREQVEYFETTGPGASVSQFLRMKERDFKKKENGGGTTVGRFNVRVKKKVKK